MAECWGMGMEKVVRLTQRSSGTAQKRRPLASRQATEFEAPSDSTISPIPRSTPLMRNSKNINGCVINIEVDGVREVSQQETTGSVFAQLPPGWRLRQRVDGAKGFRSERLCCLITPFQVPMERCCYLCLGFGQKKNFVETHRLVNFARASAQGTATVLPSRSPALRRSISRRQASEMLGSSLPSKLSNKAATRAERSPVGSVKASSSKLSTRAFMFSSLAPLLRGEIRVRFQSARYAVHPAA